MYETLGVIALFAFAYSVVAKRLDRTPVNGALVYLAVGMLAGSSGLGLLKFTGNSEWLRVIAELTLALVLFSDAANADLAVLRRSFRIPQRLLLLGLPLTILLGVGAGVLIFPGLGLLEIAILATILVGATVSYFLVEQSARRGLRNFSFASRKRNAPDTPGRPT